MHLDGQDAVKQMVQGWLTAFPDLQHEIIEEFESDGHYACRLIVRGTHEGPFATPNGEIPATGRSIAFASADYITGEGGKASRWFAYPDMAGLIAQIS
jgi:predicted ester cyclase